MKTKEQLIDDLLSLAFAEDIGDGDHTTLSTIPSTARGRQRLIIKEEGIIAGVEVARMVFERLDPDLTMTVMIPDGEPCESQAMWLEVEGPGALLAAGRAHDAQHHAAHERHSHHYHPRYQERLKGLKTTVLDTRKTTPGMRMLGKGGGEDRRRHKPPHRSFRYDPLIKDNHVDFAGEESLRL